MRSLRLSIAISSSSSSSSSSVLRSSPAFGLGAAVRHLRFLRRSHEVGSCKSAGIRLPEAAAAAKAGRASGWKSCVRAGMANAAAAPSRLRNVFVYGSLLAEEVLDVLIKRVPPRVDALLENFQRYCVRGRVYPAAVPVEGSRLIGKILLELTDDELIILDKFEGSEYIKLIVEPRLMPDNKLGEEAAGANGTFQAFIYVWEHSADEKLFGDWDYEEWRRVYLKDYIAMCQEFISELANS